MKLDKLHPNTLALKKAPDGIDPSTWEVSKRRELLSRLIDLSISSDNNRVWEYPAPPYPVEPPSPFPIDGLTKAFSEAETIHAFLSFVTRDCTPLGPVEDDFNDARYHKIHLFSPQCGDTENSTEDGILALKRARRVTDVIFAICTESSASPLAQLLIQHSFHVFSVLFRSFRNEASPASVFHLCRILEGMIRLSPNRLVQYLVEGSRTRLILHSLLANCQCSVVVDLVVSLLSIPFVRDAQRMDQLRLVTLIDGDVLKQFHRRIGHANPFEVLVRNVLQNTSCIELKHGSVEVIVQCMLFYESNTVRTAGDGITVLTETLFQPLADANVLDRLCRAGVEDGNEASLTLFYSLCKLASVGRLGTGQAAAPAAAGKEEGEDGDDDDDDEEEVQRKKLADLRLIKQKEAKEKAQQLKQVSKLNGLKQDLSVLLVHPHAKHFSVLCTSLEEQPPEGVRKHSSYHVQRPFGHVRLQILRCCSMLLELYVLQPNAAAAAGNKTSLVPLGGCALPWKNLVKFQAEYPQNNFVQIEFAKMVRLMVLYRMEDVKFLLVECKLVSQLLKRAKAMDSDRFLVLQTLNVLRLKLDVLNLVLPPKLNHNHWFVQYFKSHAQFKEFLPELKRITFKLLFLTDTKQNDFACDPDNPLLNQRESRVEEEDNVVEEEKHVGLQSEYAKQLGFTSALMMKENAWAKMLVAEEEALSGKHQQQQAHGGGNGGGQHFADKKKHANIHNGGNVTSNKKKKGGGKS